MAEFIKIYHGFYFMKIASFNVNSLRARLPIVTGWLKINNPDILCLQETKVQDHDFPADQLNETGYKYAFKGQKSYNGVAILSKHKINNITFGLDSQPKDMPRLIKADICNISIVNTYVPQGYSPESEKFQYKLNWFKRLRKFFDKHFKPSDHVIWLGDINIAPLPIDVYDPENLIGSVCFCPQASKALQKVIDWGFVDIFRKFNSQPGQYTFWDYRLRQAMKTNSGWRLDHIMATKSLAEKSAACYIDKTPRMDMRPSDHTPIIAEFNL